jgi:flagellar biosynthesis/type III secretory pathway protein FliH
MPGIIKAGQLQGRADSVQTSVFNFEDISQRANHYLDTVRHEAARILERANQQVQRLEDEAKSRGLQKARQETEQVVEQKLRQRMATLQPAMEQAICALEQSRQDWLQHWERQTVHLAASIAQRIIRRELRQTPEITLDLIREALELAVGGGRIRLHLNPHDYRSLNDQVGELASRIQNLAPADIIADPEVTPGGCRVVTEFGSIDQQIESQLARIEEELA